MNLLQRGKKRNKRGPATARWGLILGRIDITHRPAIVDVKLSLGDWELNSIIGAKHRGGITSMVEGKSKLTILVPLDGPTSEATKKVLNAAEILHSQSDELRNNVEKFLN